MRSLMIHLNNVTLLAIDGAGSDTKALPALRYSSASIRFGDTRLLTSNKNIQNNFCSTHIIEKMNMNYYNYFCINQLHQYFDTDYVLLVQSDGFILNPHLWQDEFLNYDYIGAAWPEHIVKNCMMMSENMVKLTKNNKSLHQVGNGGFTLRSKKLLQETNELYENWMFGYPEDVIIGIGMREKLQRQGYKFAPVDLAIKFSCEHSPINGMNFTPEQSFGFHGKMVHPHLLDKLQEVL